MQPATAVTAVSRDTIVAVAAADDKGSRCRASSTPTPTSGGRALPCYPAAGTRWRSTSSPRAGATSRMARRPHDGRRQGSQRGHPAHRRVDGRRGHACRHPVQRPGEEPGRRPASGLCHHVGSARGPMALVRQRAALPAEHYWPPGTSVAVDLTLMGVDSRKRRVGSRQSAQASFRVGSAHPLDGRRRQAHDDGHRQRPGRPDRPHHAGRPKYPTVNGIHFVWGKRRDVLMDSSTVGIPATRPRATTSTSTGTSPSRRRASTCTRPRGRHGHRDLTTCPTAA